MSVPAPICSAGGRRRSGQPETTSSRAAASLVVKGGRKGAKNMNLSEIGAALTRLGKQAAVIPPLEPAQLQRVADLVGQIESVFKEKR